MRQAAAITGGRCLFLTDDSGVGYGHAEPRISCYLVTGLRSPTIRVLQAELAGTRVEPAPSEIVRQVGTCQKGRCLD